MRWLVLSLGFVLVAFGLYLPVTGAPSQPETLEPDVQTRRMTSAGPIIGGLSANGSQTWLGIPYAAAPVGNRRWRAPAPLAAWAAPRETVRFASVCPQFASLLSSSGAQPGTLIGDEDCLFLNVFSPGGVDSTAALPVMVFVHGGGNTIGSASTYDGSAFAQEQGVVMVTLNFRLGVLGWFSHASLRDSAESLTEASGNFALLDIIAGLDWVQNNIRSFGGDPERVTVFGESAGGSNIFALLATPLAKDLFYGAIIQSGSPRSSTLLRAENPATDPQPGHPNSSHELLLKWLPRDSDEPRRLTEATLARLPPGDLAVFLRGLSVTELMSPLNSSADMYSIPQLFRDGVVLPGDPLPRVFADAERWNQVPLLVGANRDEAKLFMVRSKRHTRQRFGLIPQARDVDRYDRLARYRSDAIKAIGVDLPLAAISASAAQTDLYAYRFDWDDMRKSWFLDLPQLLGAAHSLELDFLFPPLMSEIIPGMFYLGNRENREALGRSMRDYWAGFAYAGRPGSGRSAALPAWPQWTHQAPRVMILDEPGGGGLRPATLFLSPNDIKGQLRKETELGERTRCALYVDLFLDNNGISELFDAREYQALGCGQFPSWSLAGMSR